jgi:hypothetical protein
MQYSVSSIQQPEQESMFRSPECPDVDWEVSLRHCMEHTDQPDLPIEYCVITLRYVYCYPYDEAATAA